VSHLEEQLSALVDGELNGAELDRVNAHLAACGQCRSEAAALRLLKRELRQLAAAPPSADLTRRLLSLAASEGVEWSPQPDSREASPSTRFAPKGYVDRPGTRRDEPAERGPRSRSPHSPDADWRRRRRNRRLAWGAISFVITVGMGAAAYSVGEFPSEGRMTPQLELYSVGHAILGGDFSIPSPSGQPTRKPPTVP
jgi:anti-sigma factor RsiW